MKRSAQRKLVLYPVQHSRALPLPCPVALSESSALSPALAQTTSLHQYDQGLGRPRAKQIVNRNSSFTRRETPSLPSRRVISGLQRQA